jgi:hypothetical protein
MNIFAIEGDDKNIDWVASAKSQDNYRVVKMILESCQMLCTNLNYIYKAQVTPYRSVMLNHPCTIWARESSANFRALLEHTAALIEEYEERFPGKTHKCKKVYSICKQLFEQSIILFPKQEPTPIAMAMPDCFKSDNVVESYRKYYASKPRMRYPKDKVPDWFVKYRGDKEYQIIS